MTKPTDVFSEIAVTYDDVLLEPRYSEVVPSQVDVSTNLTKRIRLTIPIISSPMDTVTQKEMAIALAREGGLGIIHKNMSVDAQAEEVAQVKRSANGIIREPATLPPNALLRDAQTIMEQQNVSGVPIVENGGKLVGIITRRDLRFQENWEQPVDKVMTSQNLVIATGNVTLAQAETILMEKKVEKLLLVDNETDFRLTGLITIKDIDMVRRYPNACKDPLGRLRVGAAVSVYDYERIERLIAEGVDVLVVDSAHGHSSNVIETVREIKKRWDIDIIAGNIATEDGCLALIRAGADAVKIGIGPGSICTTRVVSGVGVPQITAIHRAATAACGTECSIIADGGIRFSGDVTKAIAAGAHLVMLGGLLAGLEESPGELILYQGRTFKSYRGMGSMGAMVKGSSERYRQSKDAKPEKLVPEGVEGRVPYRGMLGPYVYQLIGGLRAGMGYCGTPNIEDLRANGSFIRVSSASVREGHPHDISITQEAPNYNSEVLL
ncbi:MAG: IMP dehydrogenase [Planctomycetaceae bacterium]|nr:IMP dehydrogenase [Planctomycetaceae bacterium]